jgi:hypothetical protein
VRRTVVKERRIKLLAINDLCINGVWGRWKPLTANRNSKPRPFPSVSRLAVWVRVYANRRMAKVYATYPRRLSSHPFPKERARNVWVEF